MEKLLAELSSPDHDVRDHALVELEHQTRGKKISTRFRPAVLELLSPEEPWVVRLHLVRILDRIDWELAEYAAVLDYLFEQAEGKNKFVAAWSLDSLATFAIQDASIEDKVVRLLLRALESGTAAVKVRARHGLQRLDRATG